MRPSSRELVNRDPALASILGMAHLTRGQNDFGYEDAADASFGNELAEFGIEDNLTDASMSNRQAYGDIVRGQYGNASVFDTDASRLRGDNSQLIHLQRVAMLAQRQAAKTEERLMLLDPNCGSTEKIGRYTFSLNQQLVLGVPEAITITNNPTTDIKPEKLIFNAPAFNFALISVLQIGNVSVIIGGFEDAANYGPTALGVHVSMPLLRTSNRAQVTGEYTGLAPAPYTSGAEYSFTLTLQGPARMTI